MVRQHVKWYGWSRSVCPIRLQGSCTEVIEILTMDPLSYQRASVRPVLRWHWPWNSIIFCSIPQENKRHATCSRFPINVNITWYVEGLSIVITKCSHCIWSPISPAGPGGTYREPLVYWGAPVLMIYVKPFWLKLFKARSWQSPKSEDSGFIIYSAN